MKYYILLLLLLLLSCCLVQNLIAVSIVNRSKLINSDMLHSPNHQFVGDFMILESELLLI
jgi:hypothetical protein